MLIRKFLILQQKKFVTKFVTRITNFVTCVRNFVTRITNFVTNFFCADNENLQGERKKMLRESKKSEAGRGKLESLKFVSIHL